MHDSTMIKSQPSLDTFGRSEYVSSCAAAASPAPTLSSTTTSALDDFCKSIADISALSHSNAALARQGLSDSQQKVAMLRQTLTLTYTALEKLARIGENAAAEAKPQLEDTRAQLEKLLQRKHLIEAQVEADSRRMPALTGRLDSVRDLLDQMENERSSRGRIYLLRTAGIIATLVLSVAGLAFNLNLVYRRWQAEMLTH